MIEMIAWKVKLKILAMATAAVSLLTFCPMEALGEEDYGANSVFTDFVFSGPSSRYPGEMLISESNPYCDWGDSQGPICLFNGTNQVVVIPEGFTLPDRGLRMEIHSAKTVHLYPACVSWITVISSSSVTTFPYKDKNYLTNEGCRTWLQLRGSQADSISYGVKDFTLSDSSVNTINLVKQIEFMAYHSTIKSIEALHWQISIGSMFNTTVQSISHLEAEHDFMVTESHLGFIFPDGITFSADSMEVVNSSVARISSGGLKIKSGVVILTNVVIGELDSSSIMIEDPDAVLVLTNVTIFSAAEACFVLLDRGRIITKGLTIGNVSVDISSPYFMFEDDFVVPENATEVYVEEKSGGCSSENVSLICDFGSVNETIEIDASYIEGYDFILIKNAKSLLVLSTGCNKELQLESVNGTLPHFATMNRTLPHFAPENDTLPYFATENSTLPHFASETGLHSTIRNVTSGRAAMEEDCGMTLSVKDSELDVISGKYISNMFITNSTLRRLHEGILETFNVQNATVGIIDSVNISGSGSNWTKMEVGSLFNLTLQAPIIAENFVVHHKLRRGALIIDHVNATTEISNGRFSIMEKDALRVKAGKLVLKNFAVDFLKIGAIFVEEGASLELELLGMMIPFFGAISVATKNQVMLKGTDTEMGDNIIQERHPPSPPPDMGDNFTISSQHTSPYCDSIFFSMICTFSYVQNGSVIVDIEEKPEHLRTVEIREVSTVTLYPSCVQKVVLVSVTEAMTIDGENECATWLEGHNVHFKNIIHGVHEVSLFNCVVDLFSPSRILMDLDLVNTRVQQMTDIHWSGYSVYFNNCYLNEMRGIVALSTLSVRNTTMEKIHPQGLTIIDHATIDMSRIGEVASEGITVKGLLHLDNVSISSLAKNAILVRGGVLFLSNVNINYADPMSIMATASGAIAMQNVTVAGKRVHWRGYITDDLEQNSASSVFLNKLLEEDRLKVTAIPVVPDEITRQTTESLQKKGSSSPNVSLWEKATFILVVILAVMVSLVVYLAVKSRVKRRTLVPQVSWQAREDQTHLLVDAE